MNGTSWEFISSIPPSMPKDLFEVLKCQSLEPYNFHYIFAFQEQPQEPHIVVLKPLPVALGKGDGIDFSELLSTQRRKSDSL